MATRFDRREFLRMGAALGAGALIPGSRGLMGAAAQPILRPAPMARFPEKTDLILLTDRPPNLETPLRYFRQDLTPNEAFFVRWHWSAIPTSIDSAAFRLSVGGHVERPLRLSPRELRRRFQPVSVTAVCQCSGNSRSFFEPRVVGGQWGHGAMGNAKWTGVPLRDLLQRAGVRRGAVDVSFAALDLPPWPDTPQFVKSLEAGRAMDGEVIVAYAMNDADLPMLNGFPLRLIVPGWYATYWVKSLNQITVHSEKFKGFWMDKAYRIPANAQAAESPQQLAAETVPINSFSVHSIFVRPEPQERLAPGRAFEIEGLAMDGGAGIRRVEVSTDAAQSWADARLDPDLGKYSWRRWRFGWTPRSAGSHRLMCRATNSAGQTQSTQYWNRSGYQRNVIEHVDVTVV
jgi:sulfite dehydrogenase (cytochrome) subunit A